MSKATTPNLLDQVRVPEGVKWKVRVIHAPPTSVPRGARAANPKQKAKLPTLAELNKRLGATRTERLAAAEQNGIQILGRTRL